MTLQEPAPMSMFLSYSREDIVYARQLREWLLERGHEPWMDLFDIPAGARWPDEIDRALRSSDVVIGLMSPASVASENVKNEWDWAIANGRRLILLLIVPCDVPFHYISRNYVDFTEDQDAGFSALAGALASRTISYARQVTLAPATTTTGETPPKQSHAFTAPRTGSRLRRAMGRQPTLPALVGREQEQERLRALLDSAVGGEGALALLGGEAGIGKTTLTRWLQAQSEERGALVLSGGCYDLATTPPYGPWVEILRVYQPQDGLPPMPAELRDDAGLASIPSQAALFDIVGDFFAEVSEHRPLLLVLEDLHWADVATLEFLRFFARFLTRLPILTIATYRDDELTRRHPLFELLPLLVREAEAERLSLERLDANAVRSLINRRYTLDDTDADRLEAHLARLAEGNPFFTGELLVSLEEDGSLTRDEYGWHLGDLETVQVPPLVRQVVERRLARLNDASRHLLEIAAVIGHEARLDLWTQVSEASEEALVSAMRQALDAHLLDESPDGDCLRFHHALTREALYLGIVPIERRRWHRQVAEALIEKPRPDPDAVLTHLEQAHDPRQIEWFMRAGERAKTRLAWEVAIERYERALELTELQAAVDPMPHCEVLLALGGAQDRAGVGRGQTPGAGNDPEARATYWHAAEVARSAGLHEHLARAALGFVGMSFGGSHGAEAGFLLMGEALGQLPAADSTLRARLLARRALAPVAMRTVVGMSPPGVDVAQAEVLAGEAIAMARRLGDSATLAYTLTANLEMDTGLLHEPDAALHDADEVVRIGTALGDLETISWGLQKKHSAHARRGEIDRAAPLLHDLERVTDRLKMPVFQWFTLIKRTGHALCTGQLQDAQQFVDASEATWPNSGVTKLQLLMLRREQCRLEEVGELFQERFGRYPNGPTHRAYWLICLLDMGRLNQASELLAKIDLDALGSLPRNGTWLRVVSLLAEAGVALDAVHAIQPLYALLHPYAALNLSGGGHHDNIGGSAALYLGLLAGAMEDWHAAEAHFATALEQHRQWGYRLYVAHTQYGWAEMLTRRNQPGDRERALELLDEALAQAREIGMVRLERLASELRGQLSPRG